MSVLTEAMSLLFKRKKDNKPCITTKEITYSRGLKGILLAFNTQQGITIEKDDEPTGCYYSFTDEQKADPLRRKWMDRSHDANQLRMRLNKELDRK